MPDLSTQSARLLERLEGLVDRAGNVSAFCDQAGISRPCLYSMRRKLADGDMHIKLKTIRAIAEGRNLIPFLFLQPDGTVEDLGEPGLVREGRYLPAILSAYRRGKGYGIRDLERALGASGTPVSDTLLYWYETGAHEPHLDTLESLGAFHGLGISYLRTTHKRPS